MDGLRDLVRDDVNELWRRPKAVLVIARTGVLTAGKRRAGVARKLPLVPRGRSRMPDRGSLDYVSRHGHAFIATVRCILEGMEEIRIAWKPAICAPDAGLRTQQSLRRRLIARAMAALSHSMGCW